MTSCTTLRPFVRDGASTINVTTNNPSLDDNVFLATFTMNPPFNQPLDAHSQVEQAIAQLPPGIGPDQVDLVTVGMGGNDAGFKGTVENCITMSIGNEVVRRMAGSVAAWVLDQVGVQQLDKAVNGERLAATGSTLPTAEADAGRKILGRFPGAQVVQLDYPNSLPAATRPSTAAACAAATSTTPRPRPTHRRCRHPRQGSDRQSTLAIGVHADDVRRQRALPRQPGRAADQRRAEGQLRRRGLPAAWATTRCWPGRSPRPGRRSRTPPPVSRTSSTRSRGATPKIATARDRLLDIGRYLSADPIKRIKGNLASRPGTTDDSFDEAFDRSFNLFHPNPAGIRVLACDALATYQNRDTGSCATAPAAPTDSVNGHTAALAPVTTAVKQAVNVVVRGFRALSPVHLRLFSEPVDLGTVTADADCVVTTTVTVPAVGAGVRALQADGEGAGGVQVAEQLLLDVAGRPSGEYATYLCFFSPAPRQPGARRAREQVGVTVGGVPLGTFTPDETGGVLVRVPSVDRLTDPSTLVISGRSTLTGKVVTKSVSPIPTTPALWAAGTGTAALSVIGAGFTTNGLVHTEGGGALTGARIALTGGTEYPGTLKRSAQGSASPFAGPGRGGPGCPAHRCSSTTAQAAVATSGAPYVRFPHRRAGRASGHRGGRAADRHRLRPLRGADHRRQASRPPSRRKARSGSTVRACGSARRWRARLRS